VQPHHLRQILGLEQLLPVVQGSLDVLFGIGNRLAADVLGTGAGARALLLDPGRGLLGVATKFSNVLRA
jgi:hypothetical protein